MSGSIYEHMKKLNLYFSLLSLNVLLVTVERFSFTTKIVLEPYSFLRLHELFQMSVIILFTVLLPFLILKEVTHGFEDLKKKWGTLLGIVFIAGIYFYATGNGVHEVASYFFNQYCDIHAFTDKICGGIFFNDYYTGNILYFIGAFLFTIALLFFEKLHPNTNFTKNDLKIASVNACIYAFAIFAYSAFDRVLVGLIYTIIMAVVGIIFFLPVRKTPLRYPMITYTMITYVLGGFASLVVRYIRM